MKVIARRPEASFCGRHQPPVKISPSGMVYLTSEWMSILLGSALFCRERVQFRYLLVASDTVFRSKLLMNNYAYIDRAPSRDQWKY